MIHRLDYDTVFGVSGWPCKCEHIFQSIDSLVEHIREETNKQLEALDDALDTQSIIHTAHSLKKSV